MVFSSIGKDLIGADDEVPDGSANQHFSRPGEAANARTGQVLWQFKTGSGIVGQPISYRGPDGKQYIAILSGIGGWPGSIVNSNLDTRDDTAGNGWGSAMRELKTATAAGGTLYVFALP